MSANAAVIDLFTTAQDTLTDTTLADGGLSSTVDTAGDDIIGGERDLFVELLSSPDPTSLNASIGVNAAAGGFLSFSTDSQAAGTGIVQWDGDDNSIALDVTGLGGVNLAAMGNAFAIDVIQADLGFNFVIELYTDADNFTQASLLSSGVAAPTTIFLSFADFLACGAVGPGIVSITCGGANDQPVDLTNLGAIQLIIDPLGATTSLDLSIDNITTVPEPSVLGLMGAGLLAGGLVGRARSKKKAAAAA